MARGSFTSPSTELVSDSTSVLITVAAGEQLRFDVTLDWLTDLTGYVISAKLIEGLSDTPGEKPTRVAPDGKRFTMSQSNGCIQGVNDGDNRLTIVVPHNLSEGLLGSISPNASVFMYFDLEIGEPGVGDPWTGINNNVSATKQIWKPLRGLVEIMYSTTGV